MECRSRLRWSRILKCVKAASIWSTGLWTRHSKKALSVQRPAALNWQEFFAGDLSSEQHNSITAFPSSHRGTHFPGWKISPIRAWPRTRPHRGGWGRKSRMLLELARHEQQKPHGPRVRFLNLSRRGLTGEQSDFLAREEQELASDSGRCPPAGSRHGRRRPRNGKCEIGPPTGGHPPS